MDGIFYSVTSFGAAGDGRTLNTKAIQQAIDTASEAGGGTVYVPSGDYFCGCLTLKSNVTLYLEANARLIQKEEQIQVDHLNYDRVEKAFLYGLNVEHVSICGKGVIIGGAPELLPRPILFRNCAYLLLEGVEVTGAREWAVTFDGCHDVRILGARVINNIKDGIDLVCCQNVLIDGVTVIGAGDDAICLKNESENHSPETMPPCGYLTENVIISNCLVMDCLKEHPAVKIGTGTAGIFRNIIVHDCIFQNMNAVFCIQVMRPTFEKNKERYIENVQFSNIITKGCKYLLDITQMDVDHGMIRNISMDHIVSEGLRAPGRVIGLKDAPVEQLSLCHMVFKDNQFDAGEPLLHMEYVHNVTVSDWNMNCEYATALDLKNCQNVRAEKMVSSCKNALLTVAGEESDRIAYIADPIDETGEAVVTSAEVGKTAINPILRTVEVRSFSGDNMLLCGKSGKFSALLRNSGSAGFLCAPVLAGTSEVGTVRAWMGREEEREVSFLLSPIYEAGEYELTLLGTPLSVTVKETPTDIRRNPVVEIENREDVMMFAVTVRNEGGRAGQDQLALFADGVEVDCVTVNLNPGEEKQIQLKGERDRVQTVYTIPGLLEWKYDLAANTYSKFEAEGQKIAITSGGKMYSVTGDIEYTRFIEHAAAYRRVEGDFVATVRILSQDSSGQYASAGLVICNDMQKAGDGRGVVVLNNAPKYGSMGMWRADCDGDGYEEMHTCCSTKYGYWLRIVKTGQSFKAAVSPDKTDWRWLEQEVTVPFAGTVQDVGIFSYANSAKNEVGKAVFEDFTIEELL